MQHEIVPLRCPSCGSGAGTPSRGMPFGAEFSCESCGVTSVLIINRELLPLGTLQKHGDKVCFTCGRLASKEARFCQEGHSLVRRCLACNKEFPVEHQRCDFCGRLHLEVQIEQETLRVDTLERQVEDVQSRFNKADVIPKSRLGPTNDRLKALKGRMKLVWTGFAVISILLVIGVIVFAFSKSGFWTVSGYLLGLGVIAWLIIGGLSNLIEDVYEDVVDRQVSNIEERLSRHRVALELEQELSGLRKQLSEARAALAATKDKGLAH